MYAQDDRDIRADLIARKLEPRKNVMLRCRLPGGVMTPKQWLGIDKFATENTDYGSIRLTNRQTFQFHGVLKEDIKPMHQWLHHLGLDSLATAGDVNRNVLCTSKPSGIPTSPGGIRVGKKDFGAPFTQDPGLRRNLVRRRKAVLHGR